MPNHSTTHGSCGMRTVMRIKRPNEHNRYATPNDFDPTSSPSTHKLRRILNSSDGESSNSSRVIAR